MSHRPIRKLLVANRGEIACRIFRTARHLGISTVAVYSDADARALHVREADEAIYIGPAIAAASYLNIAAIIAACQKSGADAVHPGYGFLSERAAFAKALATAGICFVGPNPAAIAAMGDKIASKQIARRAGISTVPGYLGVIDDAAHAIHIAEEIGYPVMLKASAGGGGKGMRLAHRREDVEDGFARARSEAAAAFGDNRVFIEKFIENPRHIEIQVLGDKHGNLIHLGERECSVQRRNQKILEEAPSMLVDPMMRAAMGAQAIALARAVDYDSAGTVEFIVGQDKSFYFLEMNTRLQVEHPVTEFVTGIDLVEQMLHIATGAPLALRQQDIKLQGWAIESRIYAEDPAHGFSPSTGRLDRFRPPPAPITGADLRIDCGVGPGDEISVHYDPMIAKLVTFAPTRDQAIAAQINALDSFEIEGVTTNLGFCAALMRHPRWHDGALTTGLIDEIYPQGFANASVPTALRAWLIALAASLDAEHEWAARRRAGDDAATFTTCRDVRFDQEHVVVEISIDRQGRTALYWPGMELQLEHLSTAGSRLWRGQINGEPCVAMVRNASGGFYHLCLQGLSATLRVLTPEAARLLAALPPIPDRLGPCIVRACLPGAIQTINVMPGDAVVADDTVMVIEAMKLESQISTEIGGIVEAVLVTPGQLVTVGTPLLRIHPAS